MTSDFLTSDERIISNRELIIKMETNLVDVDPKDIVKALRASNLAIITLLNTPRTSESTLKIDLVKLLLKHL